MRTHWQVQDLEPTKTTEATMKMDFFNCVRENNEFFFFPMLKVDWWDDVYFEVGFLFWRGTIVLKRKTR